MKNQRIARATRLIDLFRRELGGGPEGCSFEPHQEEYLDCRLYEIREALTAGATFGIDIDRLLADRRQIGLIWEIDDVRHIRPDLSEDQAWQVLQAAREGHDARIGLGWETLESIASDLFGDAPESTDASEA